MRTAKFATTLVVLGWLYGAPAAAVDFADGFYAGIAAGVARADDICTGVQIDCNDEEFSYEIIAGYQLSKWFSIEASYLNLGDTKIRIVADNISKDADGFTAAVVTTAPGLEQAGIFGKFGIFYTNVEYEGTDNSAPLSFDENDTELYFGLAARYPLGDTLGLSLEWERFFEIGEPNVTQQPLDTESDHDVFSASLLFRF